MRTTLLTSSFIAFLVVTTCKAQWLQQTSGMVAPLASIHCTDANTCMVAGTTTNVRKTTDGTNWVTVGSNGINNKLFIKMYSKDTVLVGQDNGTFKRSTNGGGLWSTDIAGGNINFDLFDVAFISNTNWTAVGGNPTNHATGGHITTSSTNTGASFPTFVNVSGEPTFFGIHALTTTTFVACGGAGSVYKTTDGGSTWTSKLTGSATITLYDINFPNDSIGYAVGGNSASPYATGGAVYKTTDRGDTWTQVGLASLLPNTLFGVHFVQKDTGYVVGDGGKIQVTVDGGTTWATQLSPVTTQLNKIYFPTKTTGYICGANGVILKTTTGGFIPPISVNASANTSICPGACATISISASGGVPPYTYLWNTTATTSSIVVCPTATTDYTVTVTDANATIAADSVKVTIYILPTLSISGLAASYCNTASADTLTGSPSGGTFSGAGISNGVFNAAAAGVGSHTVTYTYVTAGGCTVTTTQSTAVLPGPATVPLCLVTVDSVGVTNLPVKIVWEPPASASLDSFKIYRGGILIAVVPATAPTVYTDAAVATSTQKYDYAIKAKDTCGLETTLSATHSTIFLSPPVFNPPSSFSLSWQDYTGFTFSNYEVWRTVNNGTSWTFVANVAFANPNIYTDNAPSLAARYRIRATHPSSCTVNGTTVFKYSLSNVTDNYSSVGEISLNNIVNVYPNPSRGAFHIELPAYGYKPQELKIYNRVGELIYQTTDKNKMLDVALTGIAPGIYHLELTTDKGMANKKITIE